MTWLKQVFRNFGVLDNVDEAGVDIDRPSFNGG
jgi:hypothetical protein